MLGPERRVRALRAPGLGAEEAWDEGGIRVAGDLAKLLLALDPPDHSSELRV